VVIRRACSHVDVLLLVVDFEVQAVIVSDEIGVLEGEVGLLVVGVRHRQFSVKFGPLRVESQSIFLVHLHLVRLLLLRGHLECLIESIRVDFLQDSLKSDQRLLEDLVPMVLSKVDNDGDKHGESLLLVGLEDVQEVVVLEEAHCTVGNLQVDATDALDNSLKEAGDQGFNLLDLANFEDFLELGEEEGLLDAVSEGPVLEEAFEEGDGQGAVLGEEKHGASEELLVELGAGLDLVEGDDNVSEEDNVLVTEGHGKSGDDACKDIQKLGSAVELVGLMDQTEEALVDRFSDHFTAGHQLRKQFKVKNDTFVGTR